MANGLVVLTKTDGDGQVTTFGVPGEDDVSSAFFQTRPLELGSPDIDSWIEAIVNEIVGTTEGLTLSYLPQNRMKDSGSFVEIGEVSGDSPMFLDESFQRVARYVTLRWDDELLNAWELTGFAIWGEPEGDEDALS